jgi:tRNA nucleotidyltransferase (CCA-adding enzyme)
MGVGEDFQKFRDNYNITSALISSISYRYKRITKQLNTDFWTTDSDTAHSLYVGSYGRDTAAKGVSDLDVAFILPNAVYHQYNQHEGNGQSALLQAVKRSMQKTYPTSDASGDEQVVIIKFDDNLTFEVLPVFENKDGESFTYPSAKVVAVGRSVIRGAKSRPSRSEAMRQTRTLNT